jgi:hypothetical protein
MDGQILERNYLRDSLSRIAHRMGVNRMTANFTQELRSGPALGVPAEWVPLLRAGGLQYANTTSIASIRDATLKWTASGAGTAEFYVELAAGGDPSLANPAGVTENNEPMTRGTLGSLRAGQFGYGNNDTLGYNTIYVRLTDGADPDSKAVDFVETTTGGAWTLTPRDTGHEYASVYLYPDGLLVKIIDAMNTWTLNFTAGQVATIQHQIQGVFTTPTDVVLPTTSNYQSHLPPICESMALTIDTFSTGVVQSFTISSNNAITARPDLNSATGIKAYGLTGRSYQGTIVMEQEVVATFPFFTRADQATEMTFSANIGSTPQRLQFTASKIQFGNPSSTDINGQRGLSIPFWMNQNLTSGEAELIITGN